MTIDVFYRVINLQEIVSSDWHVGTSTTSSHHTSYNMSSCSSVISVERGNGTGNRVVLPRCAVIRDVCHGYSHVVQIVEVLLVFPVTLLAPSLVSHFSILAI